MFLEKSKVVLMIFFMRYKVFCNFIIMGLVFLFVCFNNIEVKREIEFMGFLILWVKCVEIFFIEVSCFWCF